MIDFDWIYEIVSKLCFYCGEMGKCIGWNEGNPHEVYFCERCQSFWIRWMDEYEYVKRYVKKVMDEGGWRF